MKKKLNFITSFLDIITIFFIISVFINILFPKLFKNIKITNYDHSIILIITTIVSVNSIHTLYSILKSK